MLNATNIKLEEQSSSFECEINEKAENIKVNVGGEHFILNALCALTVGTLLEIPND